MKQEENLPESRPLRGAQLKSAAPFRAVLVLALWVGAMPAAGPTARAQVARHGVAAGMLNVVQIVPEDTNNNALVTLAFGIGTFRVGTYNRADYNVLIGPGGAAAQDELLGVLMSSVTENGRDNFGTNGYPSSGIATTGGGSYAIVSFLSPGIEYNVNVPARGFPMTDTSAASHATQTP